MALLNQCEYGRLFELFEQTVWAEGGSLIFHDQRASISWKIKDQFLKNAARPTDERGNEQPQAVRHQTRQPLREHPRGDIIIFFF